LAEKNVTLNDYLFREIRKLSDTSHQTSIITTNKKLSTKSVSIKMFSRWAQENFFKYLKQEYDLDRIVHYVVNQINSEFEVVNPKHSKLTNKIKKSEKKYHVVKQNYMNSLKKILI